MKICCIRFVPLLAVILLLARFCKIGKAKAAVFPVPVCAIASTSSPCIIGPMLLNWISVGRRNPDSSRLRFISGARLYCSNFIFCPSACKDTEGKWVILVFIKAGKLNRVFKSNRLSDMHIRRSVLLCPFSLNTNFIHHWLRYRPIKENLQRLYEFY